MLSVVQIKDKREFFDFLNVPVRVNKGNPKWVPPLQLGVRNVFSDKNPFWNFTEKILFVGYRGGLPIGRIAAFYPKNGAAAEGYFGFLEGENEGALFKALLEAAKDWLKNKGCTMMKGPFNPGLNYELGVLVDGFERQPFFMMSYNPPFYDAQIKDCGFEKEVDFFAYELSTDDFQIHEKMERVNNALRERCAISFFNIDLKKFKQSTDIIRTLYNDAFQDHYGYVPFDEMEFDYMAKDMTQVIDPRLLFTVLVDGEQAGFILALPNLNEALQYVKDGKLWPFGIINFLFYKRRIKTVRVINVAIRKKFIHLGLGSLLYEEMVRRLRNSGYTGGEMSWVVEDNLPMNKAAREMGGQIRKTYRIYRKSIA